MKNQLRSANDFIIDVHALHKKYRVDSYYQSLKNIIVDRCEGTDKNRVQEIFSMTDSKDMSQLPRDIMEELDNFDPDVQLEIIEEITDLSTTHKYDEYCKKVVDLKKEFMSHRESYFWNKMVCSQIIDRTPEEISKNPKSFRDQILALWLDLSLEKIKPNYIEINYEDLNGKIKKIHAQYHEPTITEDYIESRLVDRNVGVGFIDCFFMHGFYDRLTGTQVSVPIGLIITMHSHHITELSYPDEEE